MDIKMIPDAIHSDYGSSTSLSSEPAIMEPLLSVVPETKQPLSLLDLPIDILREIIDHV
jgi:hypothetical protein